MSKPESVLIIDPAQELKFRGKFRVEKKNREKIRLAQKKREFLATAKNNLMEKFVSNGFAKRHKHVLYYKYQVVKLRIISD